MSTCFGLIAIPSGRTSYCEEIEITAGLDASTAKEAPSMYITVPRSTTSIDRISPVTLFPGMAEPVTVIVSPSRMFFVRTRSRPVTRRPCGWLVIPSQL